MAEAKKEQEESGGKPRPREADFFHIETKIKYRDQEIPVILEKYMLPMTVDEVKRGLLGLKIMSCVQEQPRDLGLYMELPPRHKDENEHVKELQGHRRLREFKDDLSRVLSLKLLVL